MTHKAHVQKVGKSIPDKGLKPLVLRHEPTRKALFHIGTGLVLLVLCLIPARSLNAQPALHDASPAPETVLSGPPERVTLTFNAALADRGTNIRVLDAEDRRVDNKDVLVNPANRFEVSVTLPALADGVYTVHYTAAALGGSTVAVGSYTFSIALPDPRLLLLTPVDGQAFEPGPVALEMQVEFFDFELYNSRIRVYADGELRDEVRGLAYQIEGLEPGVHEVKVVLARFEDQELEDTANVVHVAIAQPDEEMEGREVAAGMPPDPGLQLTTLQWVGVTALTLLLLGVGVWLGRSPEDRGV